MAKVTVTWHAVMDDRTCPVCMALNNHTWTYEVGQETIGAGLWHEQYGLVWDVNRGSIAHGHAGNCRCHVEPKIYYGNLLERVRAIRMRLEASQAQGQREGDNFS